MKFIKCVKYDIKQGIIQRWFHILPWLGIVILFCFDFHKQAEMFMEETGYEIQLHMADYLCYIFAGMRRYTPSRDIPFEFPVIWVLIFAYALGVVLKYPYENLYTHGIQIIARVRRRSVWWFSKCMYVILKMFVLFMILYGGTALYCLAFGGQLLGLPDYMMMLEASDYIEPLAEWSVGAVIGLFILPVCTAICYGLIQIFIGLIIRPIFAYISMMAVLIASAYMQSVFLPGSTAMFIRNVAVNSDGVLSDNTLLALIAYSFIAVCAGVIIFKRWDILKKEE